MWCKFDILQLFYVVYLTHKGILSWTEKTYEPYVYWIFTFTLSDLWLFSNNFSSMIKDIWLPYETFRQWPDDKLRTDAMKIWR